MITGFTAKLAIPLVFCINVCRGEILACDLQQVHRCLESFQNVVKDRNFADLSGNSKILLDLICVHVAATERCLGPSLDLCKSQTGLFIMTQLSTLEAFQYLCYDAQARQAFLASNDCIQSMDTEKVIGDKCPDNQWNSDLSNIVTSCRQRNVDLKCVYDVLTIRCGEVAAKVHLNFSSISLKPVFQTYGCEIDVLNTAASRSVKIRPPEIFLCFILPLIVLVVNLVNV